MLHSVSGVDRPTPPPQPLSGASGEGSQFSRFINKPPSFSPQIRPLCTPKGKSPAVNMRGWESA